MFVVGVIFQGGVEPPYSKVPSALLFDLCPFSSARKPQEFNFMSWAPLAIAF
jgi:hypothetical protein